LHALGWKNGQGKLADQPTNTSVHIYLFIWFFSERVNNGYIYRLVGWVVGVNRTMIILQSAELIRQND